MADRESDLRLVAASHPDYEEGVDHAVRFPEPVGAGAVTDLSYAGRRIALAHSGNRFAACLAVGARRRVTIVDDAAFLSGVALAAGADVCRETSPRWFSRRSLDLPAGPPPRWAWSWRTTRIAGHPPLNLDQQGHLEP